MALSGKKIRSVKTAGSFVVVHIISCKVSDASQNIHCSRYRKTPSKVAKIIKIVAALSSIVDEPPSASKIKFNITVVAINMIMAKIVWAIVNLRAMTCLS